MHLGKSLLGLSSSMLLVLSLNTDLSAKAAPCSANAMHALPGPFEMRFPRDGGAHPNFAIEWWYVTGWLKDQGQPIGFQITFFRAHPAGTSDNPSAFAPTQVIFAHAALSDPRNPRILFAQRARRAGFGLAQAQCDTLDVGVGPWSLRQVNAGGALAAHIEDVNLAMDLDFTATQAVLPEGDGGVSQKAVAASARSAYYSLPHLKVAGSIVEHGASKTVEGEAWLDHEWSDRYIDPSTQGWDWVGANLRDGSALMAFRMRRPDGSALYAGATRRDANGAVKVFAPSEVTFGPAETWQSPRTGATYPIKQRLTVGDQNYVLAPLMNDQEIDARDSTGTLYWEGAVRVASDSATDPHILGEGYLELTGYAGKLELAIAP